MTIEKEIDRVFGKVNPPADWHRKALCLVLQDAGIEFSEVDDRVAVMDRGNPIHFTFCEEGRLQSIRRGS